MWKAKQKNAFHISHSHDGGYGIYPNAKTETERLHKIFDTPDARKETVANAPLPY